MKKYIKSSYDRPYLYIFKHGIGPGTIPKDVSVVKTKDLPNFYTAVWLDRFLTTSELKQYDIPSETRINELLDRIGYCQKNGDVVPCDDVEACDKVMASTNSGTSDFTVIQNIYDDGPYSATHSNVPPIYTQEYGVNLDEVMSAYPDAMKSALKFYTDETFNAGDDVTKTVFADYVRFVVGEDTMYPDYKEYVKQHPEFTDPCRQIAVIINNPKCLPSAEKYRRDQGETLGRYLGKKLGLGRYPIDNSIQPKHPANSINASTDISDIDYCIYYNGDVYDFDNNLDGQIDKLKKMIDKDIAVGNIKMVDLAECQVTSVPLFIDKDGNTDYDWDNEEVEYCADADDDYAQYVKGSTDPKYMANMVSCSSYDSPYDDNDELYKYYVAGYLQKNLVGLMDEYYTNDFDDLLYKAVDMGPGLYLELTNQVTGDSVVITPDDLEEAAEYGEYPQSVYGIV